MEVHAGLLLNEVAFAKVPEQNKTVFIYEWLRSLDKRLSQSTKVEVKNIQQALTDQLILQINQNTGPPMRTLLGTCLAKVVASGDSISLYSVLNSCNDILKIRDDSPATLNKRLSALSCLAILYKHMSRLCGRSYEETVNILIKMTKQVESQTRCEILKTLEHIISGLGSTDAACLRDIFKTAKSYTSDRVMAVRLAATKCHLSLAVANPQLYTADPEATVSICMRGLDGSNYAIRLEIARLLGFVLAQTQADRPDGGNSGVDLQSSSNSANRGSKALTMEDALAVLSSGFLRGPGRFHKGASASDMLKGSSVVSRDVRAGISYAYVEFFTNMGTDWLVNNSSMVISHCLSLLISPRASQTQTEASYVRLCAHYILSKLFRRNFSEAAQIAATRHLVHLVSLSRQATVSGGGKKSGKGLIGLRSVGSTSSIPTAGPENGESSADGVVESTSVDTLTNGQRAVYSDDPNYLVCCLDLITELIRWLDSSAAPVLSPPGNLSTEIFDVCLSHPSLAVRVSAAATLRQLAIAMPSQRAPLMDRCMLGMADQTSPETLSGLSIALAGLIAGTRLSELGIPSAKAKMVFTLAEDMLRVANQNSRLTTARTQAGWFLLGACMSLGISTVRPHLSRMLLLWRNTFPRSTRELEAEKLRGDAFTWQVTLEARAGALCSIQAFLEYCAPGMDSSENVHRRILPPLDSALNLLCQMPEIVRCFGSHLAQPAAIVRHRLYRCLALLPPPEYAGGFNILLRELVAEFTLTDSSSSTTVSLLNLLCRNEDSVVLSTWHQENDQKMMEDALEQYNYSCTGSLSNDSAYIFLRDGLATASSSDSGTAEAAMKSLYETDTSAPASKRTSGIHMSTSSSSNFTTYGRDSELTTSGGPFTSRGPPPISSLVIDASIELFGIVFPYVSPRHRTQMLEHFSECIRVSKAARQEAIQVNIFAAILLALRKLSDTKFAFGEDQVLRATAMSLVLSALPSQNPVLRFAAAECVGRLAQVIGEPVFLAELAQTCFDQLRSVRDTVTRAGLCVAIGCLHRFVGGLACGQHLSTSVGVLLAVAQDSSAPTIQAWALHALALTAESGGPMFREFVQPSLGLVLRLLLKTPFTATDIHGSLAKLVGALITTLGPELQSSGGPNNAGALCLLCCSILQDHSDPLLQAEGVANLQRVHMFAPNLVNLLQFAPYLYKYLTSRHFALRRAAVACIRQISQKEANEICEAGGGPAQIPGDRTLSSTAFIGNLKDVESVTETRNRDGMLGSCLPLEAILFSLLDVETDARLRRDIEESLVSLLQTRGISHLSSWLKTLKQLLQVTTSKFIPGEDSTLLCRQQDKRAAVGSQMTTDKVGENDDDEDDEMDDDEATFGEVKKKSSASGSIFQLPPRWPTRMLAVSCLQKLILNCHEVYTLASEASSSCNGFRLNLLSDDIVLTNTLGDPDHLAHFDLKLARKLRIQRGNNESTTDRHDTSPWLQRGDRDSWLVLHLSDLVRMSFIAATSSSDQLRLLGLSTLRDVIRCFAPVPDPDSSGNRLLEQFQAQISAALRPAFSSQQQHDQRLTASTTPGTSSVFISEPGPDITAVACEVCSCWLTSGVPREAADLRRVHDLLVASLAMFLRGSENFNSTAQTLFSEAAVTRVKLAVLCAWADIFIATARFRDQALQAIQLLSALESSSGQGAVNVEMGQSWGRTSVVVDSVSLMSQLKNVVVSEDDADEDDDFGGCGLDESVQITRKRCLRQLRQMASDCKQSYQLLSSLIRPDLAELSSDWLAALRDYALVNLPNELAFQRPTTSGAFYDVASSIEQVRSYYTQSWLTLLEATALCLNDDSPSSSSSSTVDEDVHGQQQNIASFPVTRDSFFFVLGMSMEAMSNMLSKPPVRVIAKCLRVIELLLINPQSLQHIFANPRLAVELMSVLHRVILTRDSLLLHTACLRVLDMVLVAATRKFHLAVRDKLASNNEDSQGESASQQRFSSWNDGQNPEELFSRLLCPMAAADGDMTRLSSLLQLADGGCMSCFTTASTLAENVASDASTVVLESTLSFTALQVIVCVLARYHPSIIQEPKALASSPSDGTSSKPQFKFPQTSAVHHRKAASVLANSINCLSSLLRICSPDILSPCPVSTAATSSKSCNDGSKEEAPRLTGLLPIICRLVSRTVMIELLSPLQPTTAESRREGERKFSRNGHRGGAIRDSVSIGSTNNLSVSSGHQLPSNQMRTITGETDITSTSSANQMVNTLPGSNDLQQQSLSCSSSANIYAKLGLTREHGCLADAFIGILTDISQHLCSQSHTAVHFIRESFNPPERVVEDEETVSSSTPSSCATVPSLHTVPRTKLPSVDSPHCEWYQLVIASILTLLQHEHPSEPVTVFGETPRCCLTAVLIATRIVASCPIVVFRCQAVEFGLFDQLTQSWKAASVVVAGGMISDLSPLTGPLTRSVCIAAIEMLINHHDSNVSSCCVKTLMPQVFHWLYELSVLVASLPPGNLDSLFPVTMDPTDFPPPTSLLHLQEAVDAAVSLSMNVVDIAEAAGRQNLLVILVPLFCDLLSEQPSLSTLSSDVRTMVHQLALRSLHQLGSRYSTEFLNVVSKVENLKPRLEAALRSENVSKPKGVTTESFPTLSSSNIHTVTTAPAIKLKMEFNNFK